MKNIKSTITLSIVSLIVSVSAITIGAHSIYKANSSNKLDFSDQYYSEVIVLEENTLFKTEYFGILKTNGLKFKIEKEYLPEIRQLEASKSGGCLDLSYDTLYVNADGLLEKTNYRIDKDQYLSSKRCKK